MLLLDASVSVSYITCNDLIILAYFKRIFTSAQLHIAQDALRVISRDSQGDDSAHSRLTCHSCELSHYDVRKLTSVKCSECDLARLKSDLCSSTFVLISS